jgi:hypothetical protein
MAARSPDYFGSHLVHHSTYFDGDGGMIFQCNLGMVSPLYIQFLLLHMLIINKNCGCSYDDVLYNRLLHHFLRSRYSHLYISFGGYQSDTHSEVVNQILIRTLPVIYCLPPPIYLLFLVPLLHFASPFSLPGYSKVLWFTVKKDVHLPSLQGTGRPLSALSTFANRSSDSDLPKQVFKTVFFLC